MAKAVRYALTAALIAGLGYLSYNWWQATREAKAADARADSIAEVAEAHRIAADSAIAAFQRVREQESLVRDSLEEIRAQAEQDADEATEVGEVATDSLEAVLTGLHASVRPPLRPAVDTAQVQLDTLKAAHSRFRRAMETQVATLEEDTLSLVRSLRSAESALDSTRRALRSCESECAAVREARDKWRRAARSNLFGLPSAATHGGAALLAFLIGFGLN